MFTGTWGHFTHETKCPWPYSSRILIGGKSRAGPSSLHTKLEGPHSVWMQDGCKVYMASYMASNGSCFLLTWTILKKTPLGGRPNTKLGDHGTLNAHNHWFILFYHVWGPAWIEIHWNSIWLRVRLHMTSDYTWGTTTTLRDFGGFLGRHFDSSFGLSWCHGHGSWLVCEVALSFLVVFSGTKYEASIVIL